MSPTHTPGPWRVAPPSMGRYKVVTVNDLRVIGESSGYNEDGDANARLISAAPDLLQALDKLIATAADGFRYANQHGAEFDLDAEFHEARAAIAKARGEA